VQNVHYINLLLAVVAVGVRAATIAVVDEARGRHVELQSKTQSKSRISRGVNWFPHTLLQTT
jgi:hypothetical protein